MGKLITPIQHELVLDGLNELRPLQRRKEIDRVISLPVLNQEPVNNSNIATGRLLRCDNGVIAGTKDNKYRAYEYRHWDEEETGEKFEAVSWSQQVKLIQIHITYRVAPSSLYLYDSTYTIFLAKWFYVGTYYLLFVGDTIYIRTFADVGGHIVFDLRGFYKE